MARGTALTESFNSLPILFSFKNMAHYDTPRDTSSVASTTGNKNRIESLQEEVNKLEERVAELEEKLEDEDDS